MKFKRCVVALLLSLTVLGSSISPVQAKEVGISYSDAGEVFDNPERGFYTPAFLKLLKTGTTIPESSLSHNLIHLRVDIHDFIDSKFNKEALTALDQTLKLIKENGGTAIVRFAYDENFDGHADTVEPKLSLIKKHIRQLSNVLNENEEVIVCVESGMLGQCGEVHGTVGCTLKNRKGVVAAWVNNLDDAITVSVRTPTHYAEWAGIDVSKLTNKKMKIRKEGYKRIGIFNDGYLGSGNDLGTYKNRKKELKWVKSQTEKTFFGGELVAYYGDDTPINTAAYMSKEGYKTHTSYLNIQWNDKAIDGLRSETIKGISGFDYVSQHLGYRYVLKDSNLDYASDNDSLDFSVKIKNVGFGNVINDKVSTLVVSGSSLRAELPLSKLDIRKCLSKKELTYSKHLDLSALGLVNDDYVIGLRISEYGNLDLDNNYNCVRFANKATQWNEELGFNKVGVVHVEGKEPVVVSDGGIQVTTDSAVQISTESAVQVSTTGAM